MRLRLIAALALVFVAPSLVAQTQEGPPKWLHDLEKRFPPVEKNAAAEELERLALALGVKPRPRAPEADSEAKSDLDAYQQAGFGSWMDAQIKTADDSIAAPPSKLDEFLEVRRPILFRVVALLAGKVPDWGFNARQKPGESGPHPDFRMIVAMNRVLLSAALLEERSGRHGEAGEYLEASWSLSQSLADRPELVSLIITVALGKQQVGAVRKISEIPFQWFERLSKDGPRRQLVVALENDSLIGQDLDDPGTDSFLKELSKGYRSVADLLHESSPCRISRLSTSEIVERMLADFEKPPGPDVVSEEEPVPPGESASQPQDRPEQEARVSMEILAPNVVGAVRRVDRLMVDRELTLKILNLRQERAASRARRWPAKLFDPASSVCPEASYEYERRRTGMKIRFVGFLDEADAPGLILPLSFEAKPPPPAPSQPRAPNPTPAPKRIPSERTAATPTSRS